MHTTAQGSIADRRTEPSMHMLLNVRWQSVQRGTLATQDEYKIENEYKHATQQHGGLVPGQTKFTNYYQENDNHHTGE